MAKQIRKEKKVKSSFDENGVVEVPVYNPVNIYEKAERGILIFATGHSYYGAMAVNLAISLKAVDPEIKVSVVTENGGTHWSIKHHSALFDKVIDCPKEYLYVGDVRVDTKAKCFEDILSPYSETMVIDADALWLPKKKPVEIFEKFKDIDFFMYTRKVTDLSAENVDEISGSYWAKVSEIKKAYGLESGKFYNCAGEFRYFKKNEATKAIYKEVREIIGNPKVQVREFLGANFNEELSFNIAITKLGYEMPFTDFKPVHWHGNEGANANLNYVELAQQYYILSVGGNQTLPNIKREYEHLLKSYIGRLGIKTISASLFSKRDFISTRAKY